MGKSRILVCGGRDYRDRDKLFETMNYIKQWFEPYFCIIQGGANGADRLAALWAFEQGCAMIQMPANWDCYDKKAGIIRNKWMIDFAKPDLVVAFPGGTGTANMLHHACINNIDTYKVI